MKYKFSVWQFSDKEIDMICTLVRKWTLGHITLIKRASLTKQVIKYALDWGLLELRGKRLYFPLYSSFRPRYDLPTECLWRMVKPMLSTEHHTGYTIVNNPLWSSLNIYPQNSIHAKDGDMEEKQDILLELDKHHYIFFQFSGTTWNITCDTPYEVSHA